MTLYSRVLDSVLVPAYDRVRGREYAQRRRFLGESQWWDRDRVAQFQWSELQRLVRHAFASVPYLQQKYRAAGITVEDIRTVADFRRLPTLTRDEINAHARELCSTAYAGKLLPHATGGSSGTPTRFFRTYESYDWRTAAKDRVYEWSGWHLGESSVYLWGAPVGAVSRKQTWKAHAFERLQRQVVINTFSQTDDLWRRVHAEIARVRPVLVVGYVSSLEQFASFVDAHGLRLPAIRAVIAAAEPLFAPTRALVERALQAPVFNTYGSREFMSIAGECSEHGGLHVNSENLFVETRGDDPNESSEILVTDLHNYGMPFIRYDTGDCGRISNRPCPCGRGLPLLDAIEGRVLDLLKTVDGRRVPGEFFPHLLKEVPELAQYRVEQQSLDRIVISAVLSQPLSENSQALLRSEIGKVFGSSTSWEIRPVDTIPALPSGKRRVTVGLG